MAGTPSARAIADEQVKLDIRTAARRGYIAAGATHVEVHSGGNVMHIHLLRTECHLGGERVWWQCPHCGGRCAILYVMRRGIACRKCHRLRYKVESQTDGSKAFRRADKLRARLGWFPGVAFGEGSRPKGMRQTTFDNLVAKYRIAELGALASSYDAMTQVERRLANIKL